jgi:hypothetical protein
MSVPQPFTGTPFILRSADGRFYFDFSPVFRRLIIARIK